MAHWFEEIDVKSLEKPYHTVDFSSLLDKFTASPEFQGLPVTYEVSRCALERQLQQSITSILEVIQVFFKDLIANASSQILQDFSRGALVFLQCERFYCIHYWRFQKNEEFVMTRISASYLRLGNFLKSFHEECFPSVFRRMTALQRYQKEHLTEKDIVGKMELLFTKQDELTQIQDHIVTSLEDVINVYREKGRSKDPLGLYLKKTLYFIKNMLNKNSSFLKQETDNLFGQIESSLLNKIMNNNKLISAHLREKKEILKSPQINKHRNPLKNLIMMELVSNTERVHRTTINNAGKKKTVSESPESLKVGDNKSLETKKEPALRTQRSFLMSNSDSQNLSDLTKTLGERLMSTTSNEEDNKKKPHNPFLSRGSKKDAPIVASGLMNSASQKNLLIADKRQEDIYNTLNDVVIMNLHNSIMELERSRVTVDRYVEQQMIEKRRLKDEFDRKEKEQLQKKINDDVINEKQAAAQLIAEKMISKLDQKKEKHGFFSHPEKKSLKEYSEEKINTFNEGSSIRKNINSVDEENNSSLNISLMDGNQKHRSFLYRFASNLLKKPRKKDQDGDSSPEKEKTNTYSNGASHKIKGRKYSWFNKVKSLITGVSSFTSSGSTSSINDGKKKNYKMNIREVDLIRIDSNTKFKEELRYVPCKENIVAVPKDFLIGINSDSSSDDYKSGSDSSQYSDEEKRDTFEGEIMKLESNRPQDNSNETFLKRRNAKITEKQAEAGQKFIRHMDRSKVEERLQKKNVYLNKDRKNIYLFQNTQLSTPNNNSTWELVQDYMRVNQIERSVLEGMKNTYENGFYPRMTLLTTRWNSVSYSFNGGVFKD